MIIIDETKLTKGTLANILFEMGHDINDYYKPGYTQEEIEELIEHCKKFKHLYIDEIEQSLKSIKVVDYDKLFNDTLHLYRV